MIYLTTHLYSLKDIDQYKLKNKKIWQEKELIFVLFNLVNNLSELSEKNIYCGDIKPDNLLLQHF